jgi:uncharacterized membrane protein YqaE (UPF0057 family)
MPRGAARQPFLHPGGESWWLNALVVLLQYICGILKR